MVRTRDAIGVLAAVFVAIVSTPVSAQIRDAVYRGTMVCDNLPFSAGKDREAIEVTITAGAVRYTHVVRLHDTAEGDTGAGRGNAQRR